jgi:hypothetical protein
MLYPLSYGSKYWVFNFYRGTIKAPAQPQHNFEEKVLRDTSPLFKHACVEPRERWALLNS